MSFTENSVTNNGVAAMDGNIERVSFQKEQTESDPEDVKTPPGIFSNGKVITADLSETPAAQAQETHPPTDTEPLARPLRSPEPEPEATEELKPEEPKATVLTKASLATTLAPADQLWSTSRDKAVRLRMEGSGPGSETPITIHQLFLETIEKREDQPALVSKENGQVVTLTWRQYYEQCRAAAKSFIKLGLERYHGVGILGFNSPEWFIADIGCILAGGLAAGIYTTNSPEACQYVAANCEANVLVVENHKQLQKILQVKDHLPHLKAIVQYKGELQQKAPNLYTWAEFMKLGEDVPNDQLDAMITSLRANECCTLIYTSGTTGNPKGVMLSHDNMTWTANSAAKLLSKNGDDKEVLVSYLPLSHVAAQMIDMYVCMSLCGTTYFAEPDALKGSLVNTLKEARPTFFLGVPRVWEKMQERMKAVGAKASPMKKRVANWAKSIGLQYTYSAMNGENLVPWGYTLANNLVFKKVRANLGLDRCKFCFTGAAPITKETLDYFMSLNIPVMELYGMSESSGPHTVSIDEYRITSCGKEMPGCKTKLENLDADGNGEICFWGRHVFMGYLNMADKTTEALDEDGWLHSGDLGRYDVNNFLYITGRIKELIITAGGENIPPVPIEDAVKAEVPIISNVMLIGDKLKFLSMLLTLKCVIDDNGDPTDELSPEALDFCRQNRIAATKVSEIIASKEPAVYKAIQEGMERVNARSTSNAQKVQKWVILERDFTVPGGELGPTMKLRRPIVVKMYQDRIDEMYAVAERQ